LFGCKENNQDKRLVIWTDCPEFSQYIELFNKTHKDNSAILVYKENPALSLPAQKDEVVPDIIIGSWLRNENTTKYFKQLDSIFDRKSINDTDFYPQLLESGKIRKTQYLLPVSFNLPAIIFSTKNSDLISEHYTLTLEQIRESASGYNVKNKDGVYSRIGFTPLSNENFLYLTTKLHKVDIRDGKNQLEWNEENLQKNIEYMREWVRTDNTSAQVEEEFAYKYLFMPYYRQVTSDRTLFAYTTSDVLFKAMNNQDLQVDYRWICEDNVIPIEDSYTMLGIYKKAKNLVGATEFITWFFQAQNQKQILDRKEALNLNTDLFGIVGGFSSIRDVNEHILPVYYTQLLSNLPPAQMLEVPQKLPVRWDSMKSSVIDVYLKQSVVEEDKNNVTPIRSLEAEWRKKVFEK
jgi:ABC-type glycerol-3-phosphate transport system substrate-binding protein